MSPPPKHHFFSTLVIFFFKLQGKYKLRWILCLLQERLGCEVRRESKGDCPLGQDENSACLSPQGTMFELNIDFYLADVDLCVVIRTLMMPMDWF